MTMSSDVTLLDLTAHFNGQPTVEVFSQVKQCNIRRNMLVPVFLVYTLIACWPHVGPQDIDVDRLICILVAGILPTGNTVQLQTVGLMVSRKCVM